MATFGNYCLLCETWPEDLKQHYLDVHGITKNDLDGNKKEVEELDPKIYVRLVDYQYDSTTIQLVTLDMEKAFNFVPEEYQAIETEIRVYQGGEEIELWEWRINSHSFVKRNF